MSVTSAVVVRGGVVGDVLGGLESLCRGGQLGHREVPQAQQTSAPTTSLPPLAVGAGG